MKKCESKFRWSFQKGMVGARYLACLQCSVACLSDCALYFPFHDINHTLKVLLGLLHAFMHALGLTTNLATAVRGRSRAQRQSLSPRRIVAELPIVKMIRNSSDSSIAMTTR